MPFSGPCYLARCDLITDRVWIYMKCNDYAYTQRANCRKLIFPVNTTVPINAMYKMHINLTPKGINTKLSVSHQYLRQMGPIYAVIPANRST